MFYQFVFKCEICVCSGCAILFNRCVTRGFYIFGFLLVLIGVSVGIPTLFLALHSRARIDKYIGVCSINPQLMVECFPGLGEINFDTCLMWDCCWREELDVELTSVSAPRCYHRLPSSYRLMVSNQQFKKAFNTSLGNDLQFPLRLDTYQTSVSTNWIKRNQLDTTVQLSVFKATNQRFQLQFTTTDLSEPLQQSKTSTETTTEFLYNVKAILADGKAHGVIFNTNQVVRVSLLAIPALVIRTAGPIFDVHVALGPRPADVISQLTDIAGFSERPALPPFWALGYHLCPVGKVDVLEDMKKLKKHSIPLASHCIDSYLLQELIFENEDASSKRNDSQDILNEMKKDGVKVLAVTFPQVAVRKRKSEDFTFAFTTGSEKAIFLESNLEEFWSGVNVSFPDPTHPDAPAWLEKVLTHLSSEAKIHFDGYILHWNTPLDLRNFTEYPCLHVPGIPLQSNFENVSGPTLCPEEMYQNGQTHKQIGNKYGHLHTALMAKALEGNTPKRPFLLSLASSTGSGHWGGIWGGMYYSDWESLQRSILHVQEASIYGIPLSGVPLCGHLEEAEINLCARWFQAGAFYPLALSFYNPVDGERNPLSFNKAFTFFVAQALKLRYSLLPYLYTLFYNAHKHGSPVLRPLFFEFPQYKQTRSEKNVFLWGEGLLFIPCVEKQKDSVLVWLPNVDWYEFYSGKIIEMPEEVTNGKWVTIPTPMYYINVYIHGGHAIFTQTPHTSIAGTRKSAYVVYAGLDRKSLTSRGYLVIDDGESIGGPELHVTVEIRGNSMSMDVKEDNAAFVYLKTKEIGTDVDRVRIYGIEGTVNGVEVNGNKLQTGILAEKFLFSDEVLDINYNMPLNASHLIKWTIS
uniref:P-type domain-containing protein n=1 Tax=Strigamia maritima TaxID=126957 RepID=T1J814_STRMM